MSEADLKLIDAIKTIEGRSALVVAYDRGISEDTWREMAFQQSVPQIQSMLRRLSPLEKPGVGTLDYLHSIPEIETLYLFFRQWLYYVELDLPVQHAATNAPLSP